MINYDTEIEHKLDASNIDLDQFCAWCEKKKPFKRKNVKGIDIYYKQGNNILRNRIDPQGRCELTVKLRKSNKSIINRLEIDIYVDVNKTKSEDVTKFLGYTGWKEDLKIIKDASIYWYKRGKAVISVVSYLVFRINNNKEVDLKKFIECEVEKGSKISVKEARKLLTKFKQSIECDFGKLKQIDRSIYEIYTKNKYKLIKSKRR